MEYTALQLGEMIRKREISCREAVEHSLSAIRDNDGSINACIHVMDEYALAKAAEMQRRLDSGEEASPLAGVPVVVKDNICTRGIPTTCASKMLDGFTPIYDATAYVRILASGALPVAKTNMDEFAMGSSTETSYFGPTRNPWDTSRVPGGSSGGTAAAIAAGQATVGLGSDTGGSIRQPCSFCGISGVKPTYGAVSRYGLIAYASSLDQLGVMGRDILDCAAMLSIIQGIDKMDSTSARCPATDMERIRRADIHGMRIGIPSNYFGGGLDSGVAACVLEAAGELERQGAVLVDLSIPITEYAIPSYYIIACAEASSNLSRYDGLKYGYSPEKTESLEELYIATRSEGFGMEVKRRIMLGSFVLSSGYYDAYYMKAMQARKLIMQGFEDALSQCDVILSPVAPTVAYRLGENTGDPLRMYLGDIYTVSVNLAGLPAVSVPCGFAEGMPVGMQLIGRAFDENTLFTAAHRYQLATGFHTIAPKGAKA